jgi:magnesium-transporting ATPase (P-type)
MFMYDTLCLCMTTPTEVFPCFSLSCKANARVKLAKTGHGPHSSYVVVLLYVILFCSMYFCVLCIVFFVTFPVLLVCICVLYYCHRVATQLQLNISYHISYHICHNISFRNETKRNKIVFKSSSLHVSSKYVLIFRRTIV